MHALSRGRPTSHLLHVLPPPLPPPCTRLQVYREGDMVSPPGRSAQTTLVPAGKRVVVG